MRNFLFKLLTLSAFLIGITFHANAQGTNVSLILTMTNGEERVFQLSAASQLYFENGDRLVIDDGADVSESFPLNEIRKMVCSEILGTEENAISSLSLFPNPSHSSFIIKGLQDAAPARIYALDGRLVKAFEATEGMVVNIDELPVGMYLLHINGETLKLMKL